MPNYWVIRPQHANAVKAAWKFCLSHSLISLGWSDLGDVSRLNKEALRERIKQIYPDRNQKSQDYCFESMWNFYHVIRPGDRVVANLGRNKIGAIGTVTRKAFFEPNKNAAAVPKHPYSNHLGVDWDGFSREIKSHPQLARLAIYSIDRTRFEKFGGSPQAYGRTGNTPNGKALPRYDEEERQAVEKTKSVTYRHRHNKMTNALGDLLSSYTVKCGNAQHCRYDALVENYDGQGRDLLIEAKPDPGRPDLRIAIGQLFDYRRDLNKPDLAVLTISRPPKEYVALLESLEISPLWFPNGGCKELKGTGVAWRKLKPSLDSF